MALCCALPTPVSTIVTVAKVPARLDFAGFLVVFCHFSFSFLPSPPALSIFRLTYLLDFNPPPSLFAIPILHAVIFFTHIYLSSAQEHRRDIINLENSFSWPFNAGCTRRGTKAQTNPKILATPTQPQRPI